MVKFLAPSILSANFYNLENDFKILKNENIKYLHLDVMDGVFVPNISLGIPIIESIKNNTNNDFILDTHLMICKPERYIDNFVKAGSDILTIHKEATDDAINIINMIKEKGIMAGISINPETDVKILEDVLSIVDLVLVMSVHPGFGGQKFINKSIDKIKYLDEMRVKHNYKYMIEVDGGIYANNVKDVLDAGVDLIVSGSGVFKNDIKKNIYDFNNVINYYIK